jgi:DNA replication protein DnaC
MIPSTSTLPPGTATLAEALQAGVSTDAAPIECEFCGETLQPVGLLITYFDEPRWLRRSDDYEECSCPGAAERREKLRKEKEAALKAEQKRAYREKVDQMIEVSRLGKRFRMRTFETYRVNERNKAVYDVVREYAENFAEHKERGDGLYLSGGFGTGKTHLAAAICHEVIKQGYQPIFGTMITLLERIKATYNSGAAEKTEWQIIDHYINCDLLIIDDLGKERPTGWALEKLYGIINARYEDCRPIVITANYGISQIEKRLAGDNAETAGAIVSRLYEMCRGVSLTWGDVRKTSFVREINNEKST